MALASFALSLMLGLMLSSNGGSVVVHVLDSEGQILPGATVTLVASGDCSETGLVTAISNARGVASFSVPRAQKYSIKFGLDPFVGGSVGPLTLSPGDPFEVTVRMYGIRTQTCGPVVGEMPVVTKVPR